MGMGQGQSKSKSNSNSKSRVQVRVKESEGEVGGIYQVPDKRKRCEARGKRSKKDWQEEEVGGTSRWEVPGERYLRRYNTLLRTKVVNHIV